MKRRQLCQAIAAGPILLGSTAGGAATAWAAAAGDPTADLYPVKRNERYTIARRKLTEENYAITYNNFYEFGSHKRIAKVAQKLKIHPWTVTFDGLVEKQMAVDFDTLIRHMPLEERLYRFRCVEAWSMAIPWSGFPMKALVDFAKPLSGAKYVVMETAQQKARWASFLGLGTSPISALTHDGLAFVKGLPQSVYYPQVLTWRS